VNFSRIPDNRKERIPQFIEVFAEIVTAHAMLGRGKVYKMIAEETKEL
jgi:hypothetical protein